MRLSECASLGDVFRQPRWEAILGEEGQSVEALKNAFTYFKLTMRGTPQIYYGDEIGLKGGDIPTIAAIFPAVSRVMTTIAFTAEGRIGKSASFSNICARFCVCGRSARPCVTGEMKVLS